MITVKQVSKSTGKYFLDLSGNLFSLVDIPDTQLNWNGQILNARKMGVHSIRNKSDKDYYSFRLYYRGKFDKCLCHRVMWETWVADIPTDHHIHHKDNNPSNNSLDNLECLYIGDHYEEHRYGERKNNYTTNKTFTMPWGKEVIHFSFGTKDPSVARERKLILDSLIDKSYIESLSTPEFIDHKYHLRKLFRQQAGLPPMCYES